MKKILILSILILMTISYQNPAQHENPIEKLLSHIHFSFF